MKVDFAKARSLLRKFDFRTLWIEHLGWDHHTGQLQVPLDGTTYVFDAIAQKRGFQVFVCPAIPDRPTRLKLDRQVTKSAREHLIVYADPARKEQLWEWVRREQGKPVASRDFRFRCNGTGQGLLERLEALAISLAEEEQLTLPDLTGRVKAALDVDKITKRFYERFKAEHTTFLKFIKGIPHEPDLQWYTSLMLNRLMFVYFIQKKGFLDGDVNYLRNRLIRMRQQHGQDTFYSFYRYFLLRLFHEGLGQAPAERKPELDKLLGKVPFLNGGFFEVHDLERRYPDIEIPDAAFEKLFAFFDAYRWHLDERPLRADNEINPDVVGYIFEKYVNQKQMGAYYTKEDITEYIAKNTIIPFLFDAAEKKCAIAFKPASALWALLRDDPDRYIYAAVRHGVVRPDGSLVPESELPDFVQKGMHDPQARMYDRRYNLQQAPPHDPLRLVTETWREYVARRQRCLEIREKLRRGEVHDIKDLVTLNLDIWQFARDAIVNSEGPELLRAFYRVIAGHVPRHSHEKCERGMSILDPTCGSGAFLFAALRILETLYADCLERMRRFLDELEHSGRKHSPERYADFKAVTEEVRKHHNERYFALKSIIINNLFGVDIMEEAVEICKLRLFLKLIAQVETADQIEPLPDIDFNIRPGNTLVGYVSRDEVRNAVTRDQKHSDQALILFDDALTRIEQEADAADRAYKLFRETQVRYGGSVTVQDKGELRDRLSKLGAELDRYLAGEYGINVEKTKDFEAWKTSHHPFHWLVEFFGIMRDGGFDVIIGNPPYVEYSKARSEYEVRRYPTENCGNLYAYVLERSLSLSANRTYCGMIVPLSLATTERMRPLQELLVAAQRHMWMSHFDVYPCKLFEGAKQRLTIIVMGKTSTAPTIVTTRYMRWGPQERAALISLLHFGPSHFRPDLAVVPKAPCPISRSILSKLANRRPAPFVDADGRVSFFVHRIPYNYIKAFDFVPYFRNEVDGEKKSADYKPYRLATSGDERALLATLNSNLFFWWWYTLFEGYHCGKHEIYAFPVGLDAMSPAVRDRLQCLATELMADIQRNKKRKRCRYKNTGEVVYDEFYPRLSKGTIDEIDLVLAEHFGFDPPEVDFLINYHLKYRLGTELEKGDE